MKRTSLSWCARFALFVFCAVALAHLSAQQRGAGQLRGHVVDPEGATIKGALVFVHKQSSGEDSLRMAARTDVNGDFAVALEGGGYDVLVTAPGFAAEAQTIPIAAGRTRRVEWTLKVLACNFPGRNCDTFQ